MNPDFCPTCGTFWAWCPCQDLPLTPGEPVLVSRRPRRPVRGSWGGFSTQRGVVVAVGERVTVRLEDGREVERVRGSVRREVQAP
jgi:hypothetical protein